MRYSVLGKTGVRASILGFGCMRLPMIDATIDKELAIPLLRRAVDSGINFFDTAIGYCSEQSQMVVGEALQGVRDKVVLSTKNHLHTRSTKEWRAALENSLKLLRTDYIDFYHHHGIGWDIFSKYLDPEKGGLTKEMLKAKNEGLIRHVGFSFHDHPANLIKLVDTGYYENVIVQYNLLDQSNFDAMQYAHSKGIGVIVMGPVGGGRLGLHNESILSLTRGAARSTPEAALRFVWANSAVNVALSGMENQAMLDENIAIATSELPFTSDQVETLNLLVQERKVKSGLYCSGCKYCLDNCPQSIEIPVVLDLLNQVKIYNLTDNARNKYNKLKIKPEHCVSCGACIKSCPQKIAIPSKLSETAQILDERFGTILCNHGVNRIENDGSFMIRSSLTNFSDEKKEIIVSCEPGSGTILYDLVNEHRITLDAGKSFFCTLSGTADVKKEQVSVGLTLNCDGISTEHLICERFLIIQHNKPLLSNWRSFYPEQTDFVSPETIDCHSASFALWYTDENLELEIDVRDDFLFPTQRNLHKDMLVDSVELYLDGRDSDHVGAPVYQKGVLQILLYPGTPERHPPFYVAPGNPKIQLTSRRTEDGYVLGVKVPFVSFCTSGGTPQKIGFDLGIATADKKGTRIGHFFYNGNNDNWKDPSRFRMVYLH